MPLSLGLEDTHVLITGGAGLIGGAVVRAFLSEGAHVSSVDIAHADVASDDEEEEPESEYSGPGTLHEYYGDVADEASLARAWRRAVAENGPWLRGIRDAESSWDYLENASLVLVGSESGWFGERGYPDYAAAKSAVQGGLLKSLAADAPRVYEKARVNAVAPGPVDTVRFRQECADNPDQLWLDAQATTGLGKPVPVEAVARSILFLASDNFSSHVHGQVLNVDSGKQGKVLWPKEDIVDYRSSPSQSQGSEED
ncbi:hypothetical protein BFW01_g729 [Lasiodiplodia theobromae]|nr:hypothetical protein BFW01_g729 [Lasiodiplodia theobromae]